MKIAFLNIYNGVVERGSEVFVKELADQLSLRNNVCVFQSGKIEKAAYKTQQIKGIPFISTQRFLYHFLVMVFTIKCLPYLYRDNYDWIIPVNGRLQSVICRLLRAVKKNKILITGHAGVGFEDKFNIIFGRPDVFIALTPLAHKWAKQYTANTNYIPNGVDTGKFNPGVKPMKLDLKPPVILCSSALLPYKRVDLVVQAVAKIPNAGLLLIGDGPLNEEIDTLGKKLLLGRFLHIKYVEHDKIAGFYAASSLFTLVSKQSEAFGLVYLEAMACNKPIVVPDDLNRRQIIGKAGIFCDPENIAEYANALDQALNNNWGNEPRRQAEKYSWGVIAHKYEDVCKRFLNS